MRTPARHGTKPVIAIDGPAGAGKTTLARQVARLLGLPYINTGLMYRAVTACALAGGVSVRDGRRLAALARSLHFFMGGGPPPDLQVGNGLGNESLASDEVEAAVSEVAAHRRVREILRERQRALGRQGCVMEGRDIGTVVFPDATVKIFLSAASGVRRERRRRERGGDRRAASAMELRDAMDARTTPFDPAPDAFVLDTTGAGPREVLETSLRIIRERLREALP